MPAEVERPMNRREGGRGTTKKQRMEGGRVERQRMEGGRVDGWIDEDE